MKIHLKASRMQTCENSPHDGFDVLALQQGIQADNYNYITALRRTRSAPLLVQHSDAFRSEEFDSVATPKFRKKKHSKTKGIHKTAAQKAEAGSAKSGDSPMTEGAAAQDRDQKQSPTAGGDLLRTQSVTAGFGQDKGNRSWKASRDRKAREWKTSLNGSDTFSSE
jgi:hypothetical protein